MSLRLDSWGSSVFAVFAAAQPRRDRLTYPQSSVSTGQIALASTMPMKPLYAGLITAAAIVGAILICVGCRRYQRAI